MQTITATLTANRVYGGYFDVTIIALNAIGQPVVETNVAVLHPSERHCSGVVATQALADRVRPHMQQIARKLGYGGMHGDRVCFTNDYLTVVVIEADFDDEPATV